jgi:hypothetical protein
MSTHCSSRILRAASGIRLSGFLQTLLMSKQMDSVFGPGFTKRASPPTNSTFNPSGK